jgi:hypothetical protein
MAMPAIDSKVIIRPEVDPDMTYAGIVFKVVDHARINITIEAVSDGAAQQLGRRSRLRLNPDMVTAAPEGYDAATTATAAFVPYQPSVPVGAVFTVPAGALRGVDASTLLVVIGTNGAAYKAARLGGDDHRYFPKVARAAMTVVPTAELPTRLTA